MHIGKTLSDKDKLHKIDNGTAIMSLASLIKYGDMQARSQDLEKGGAILKE